MTIRFQPVTDEPQIGTSPGTFFSTLTANPDLLRWGDRYLLYFRGQGDGGHDEIGVLTAAVEGFDGLIWEGFDNPPVVTVGAEETAFDSQHVLDPATVAFSGCVYLYYTAHSRAGIASTGLAISEDGFVFHKAANNPVAGGLAPEAVAVDGGVMLFYQKLNDAGAYELYACFSDDGMIFDESRERRVFGPSGIVGEFDSHSISTVRVFHEEDWYYLSYGGSDRHADYPSAFGLARSRNLIDWERYPANPVFTRGRPGTWDEGAVWFPLIHPVGEGYLLWYEGTGTGGGLATPAAREASRLSREENYGGYGVTSFSRIGLAQFQGSLNDADWEIRG